jgi:type IV pilus assembly protein PilP
MIRVTMSLLALALVAGCSSKDDNLKEFIAQTKQEQPSGVEPLPEIKPLEPFAYTAQVLRSPFVPGGSGGAGAAGVRPNSNRNREYLEQFSLDTLAMVGTLSIRGSQYALIKAPDGVVHRVLPGNYMGQSDGRIISIDSSRISLTEIVPDGLGGFMERPATLQLAD